MANKKSQDPQAPRTLTRGQLSRHQREAQQLRVLYIGASAVVAVILLVLGVALLTQFVIRPSAQVASVNGTTIDRGTYNKQRRWDIYSQMRYLVYLAQLGQSSGDTTTQLTTLQNELQNVEEWPTIDDTTVGTLIDNAVLKQAASAQGINPTNAELLTAAQKDFEPQPTAIPGPSNTPTITPTLGTPTVTTTATATGTPATATASSTGTPPTNTRIPTFTATPTPSGPTSTATAIPTQTNTPLPVPSAEATAAVTFGSFMKDINGSTRPAGTGNCAYGCPSLSQDDYLQLVTLPQVLKEKVTDSLKPNVPRTIEQVHAQHILVATEEEAKAIKAELDGGYDWATEAAEKSTDTSNKDQAGDLGWFSRTEDGGTLVQEFSDGAFKLTTPGQISDPVKTSFGWHLIKLIERGNRELDDTAYQAAVDKAYTTWLDEKKAAANISSVIPPTVTPLPTTPPLPTSPPVATSTSVPANEASPTRGAAPSATTAP